MSELRTDAGDVELAVGGEHFRCVPYDTKMRRGACGERYVRMNTKGAPPDYTSRLSSGKCVECPVGEAHASAQRHPDAPKLDAPRVTTPPPATPAKLDRLTPMLGGMNAKARENTQRRRAGLPPVHRPPQQPAPIEVATKTTAPTSAPKEEPMAEKRACVICGKSFEPGRNTQRFCSSHTKAEKVAQWEKERGGAATSPAAKPAASAHKGGASAGAEKPARAPRPPRRPSVADEVRDHARAAAAHVGAAGVLRALGFQVEELQVPAGVALLVREATS